VPIGSPPSICHRHCQTRRDRCVSGHQATIRGQSVFAPGRADTCWAHMRRPFYDFFTSTTSPLAAEVLARIRELYAIEAEIRGQPAEYCRTTRQERSRPIVDALHAWLHDHVGRVSAAADIAGMQYGDAGEKGRQLDTV
jgi:hypothetical protein